MKGIKKLFTNIDHKQFKRYLFFSVIFIVTLIVISTFKFTQARYESDIEMKVSPSLAFFIVDVESQTGQIKLESMTPRTQPYLYAFTVSNFKNNKKANVDLTYSIELITTTNIPLNYKIYKGNNMTQDVIDSDTTTTDANGVYYRHLVINGASVMNRNTRQTDVYTLWVEFPEQLKNSPAAYSGIIELVDVKINAEQVV